MRVVRPSRSRGAPVIRAVLGATLDELARVGYGALTFEEVAERAGVNKTTVYRRWPTKAALVEAALTAAADAVPPLDETGDLRADLMSIARRARDSMCSARGRGLLRMLLGGCLEPELVSLALTLRIQVEAPARGVIERAVAAGALRADTDPAMLLGAMTGWILHVLFREHGVVSNERLARAVDLLIEGAAPRVRVTTTHTMTAE